MTQLEFVLLLLLLCLLSLEVARVSQKMKLNATQHKPETFVAFH